MSSDIGDNMSEIEWEEMPPYKCGECDNGLMRWWGKFDEDEDLIDMSDRECDSCDNIEGS